MQNIKSFLSYFFIKAPGPDFSYYIPMLILGFGLVIFGAIFSSIYKKKKKHDFAFKRLFKKVSKYSFIFGFTFLVLILLRRENIPYFSMRLWLYLTILAFLYFVYKYAKIYKNVYPLEKENSQRNVKVKKVARYTTNKKRK